MSGKISGCINSRTIDPSFVMCDLIFLCSVFLIFNGVNLYQLLFTNVLTSNFGGLRMAFFTEH